MPPNSPYPASTGRCLSTSTLSSTPAFASRASRSRARRRSIARLTPASEAGASTRGFSSTCGRPSQGSRRARALRRQDGPSDGQKGSCTDLRVGILASHEGTTLQAILDACATGVLRAQVVTVVSNNRDAGALQRARAAGIRLTAFPARRTRSPRRWDAAICAVLVEHAVDIVVLAGYMKKVGPRTLTRLHGRG